MDSPIIKLWCWVYGDDVENAFPVKIPSTETVGDLKEVVESKISDHVKAKDLVLYNYFYRNEILEDVLKKWNLGGQRLTSQTEICNLLPKSDDISHIIIVDLSKARELVSERPTKRPRNVTRDILSKWMKMRPQILPSLWELADFLDRPLPEQHKIPLSRFDFDFLLSRATPDLCDESIIQSLFHASEEEASDLGYTFYKAAADPPPSDVTESIYHSFWDANLQRILEVILGGVSIRDSNRFTSTGRLRPDYGWLWNSRCLFRGEEKGPENREDPRKELVNKLLWVYNPAPYVFGYFARGSHITLVAIVAPKPPSRQATIQDLLSADLRLKSGRICNLRRMINLSSLFEALSMMIDNANVEEFTTINRMGKTIELGAKFVRKCYQGEDAKQRVTYIRWVYSQLESKSVECVDRIKFANSVSLYLEPRGLDIKPTNVIEVLAAVSCVLRALAAAHQIPLYHRDIRWDNVIRAVNEPIRWFLIDWEDAAGVNALAANHLTRDGHSPRVFEDNHGPEVDIWSVGHLILTSRKFASVPKELLDIGRQMQESVTLSAGEALDIIQEYSRTRPGTL